MNNLISETIKKYAGGDDAYEQKLKESVRDTMGYSNYVDKLNQDTAGPAALGSIKGLSPTGIKSRISTRFGMQNQNIAADQSNINAIDSTAGTLASAQAAREKAGRAESEAKQREKNIDAMLNPPNWAHKVVNAVFANPYAEDGTLLSREAIKERLMMENNGISGEQGPGMEKLDPAVFDQIINDKLGDDWEDNYKTKRFEKMGFTKGQAEQQALYEQYSRGGMDPYTAQTMEEQNPDWKKSADAAKQQPGLLKALEPVPTGDNGITVEAQMSYADLKDQFPTVAESTLKSMAKPTYDASLRGDIYKAFSDVEHKVNGDKYESTDGDNLVYSTENLPAIRETPEYTKLLSESTLAYEGILTPTQVKNEIDRAIVSGNPLKYVEKFHTAESDVKKGEKDTLIQDNSYRSSVWDILK